jgi:hypothetical protein
MTAALLVAAVLPLTALVHLQPRAPLVAPASAFGNTGISCSYPGNPTGPVCWKFPMAATVRRRGFYPSNPPQPTSGVTATSK